MESSLACTVAPDCVTHRAHCAPRGHDHTADLGCFAPQTDRLKLVAHVPVYESLSILGGAMILRTRLLLASWAQFTLVLLAALAASDLFAQQSSSPAPAPVQAANPVGFPPPMNWTTEEDHQNMMDQLGIKALRPGPGGNESAPNHANYAESKANPFLELPDALTSKNGKTVLNGDTRCKQP